jgi:hypothetical protein
MYMQSSVGKHDRTCMCNSEVRELLQPAERKGCDTPCEMQGFSMDDVEALKDRVRARKEAGEEL